MLREPIEEERSIVEVEILDGSLEESHLYANLHILPIVKISKKRDSPHSVFLSLFILIEKRIEPHPFIDPHKEVGCQPNNTKCPSTMVTIIGNRDWKM